MHKISRNYVNDTLLQTSSRKLTLANIGAAYSGKVKGGVLNANIGYTKGIDLLGAKPYWDENIPQNANSPVSDYWKVTGGVSYQRDFAIKKAKFNVASSVYGQFTDDELFATEQIIIGGRSSVRGYVDANVAGNSGMYSRTELGYKVPLDKFPKDSGNVVKKIFGQPVLYGAYDIGVLKGDQTFAAFRGAVDGFAFGLRSDGKVSLTAEYARGSRYAPFMASQKNHDEVFVGINYKF